MLFDFQAFEKITGLRCGDAGFRPTPNNLGLFLRLG
jgi:hypothetical protein